MSFSINGGSTAGLLLAMMQLVSHSSHPPLTISTIANGGLTASIATIDHGCLVILHCCIQTVYAGLSHDQHDFY